jgi:hypothetical protein
MSKADGAPKFCIRRNPATGRWVIYMRAGWRLYWPNDWSRTAIATPVYTIKGSCSTQALAVWAVARRAVVRAGGRW